METIEKSTQIRAFTVLNQKVKDSILDINFNVTCTATSRIGESLPDFKDIEKITKKIFKNIATTWDNKKDCYEIQGKV